VVLVASDETYFYFMDPSTADAYTYIPRPEFLTRWHDFESEDGRIRPFYQSAVVISGASPRFFKPETRRLLRLK
jgi:hypothetical protein